MRVTQAYESYLLKVNRNDSNSNVYVPKGKFILIYNQEGRKWMNEKFPKKASSTRLDQLSELLVSDEKLKKIVTTPLNSTDFELPADFYNLASAFVIATKGDKCQKVLDAWETKPHNIRIILTDTNNRPSFEFEETPLVITSNKVKIFFERFKIKEAYASYYRYPRNIDIAGYTRLDGTASEDIDPDVNDLVVDEIISRAALETTRNSENPDAFQFAKDRTNTEQD